ncbi:hypothetical protein HMPREF3214_01526 [Alloscardovia omnicolens]|uniref:Uncharacterized protein n=1 Tax=Alloscardovia omnicolens F0580 TaxID=1321816 RepID=U1SMZ3_9BIFI|nr:hypothetical protein HMPREF9244_00040 [Alloscardovia omnicolens F0580]KWZ72810.1 hypothetical protein HMPREF3214_01526 [Alloscardovia omnicolens]
MKLCRDSTKYLVNTDPFGGRYFYVFTPHQLPKFIKEFIKERIKKLIKLKSQAT